MVEGKVHMCADQRAACWKSWFSSFAVWVWGIKLRHQTWYQESLPVEPSFWPKLEELIKIKAFLLAVSLLDLMLERNQPGSSGKAARALSPGLSLLLLTSAFSYTGADAARGPDRKMNLLPLCFLDEYGRTFPRMYVAFVEEFPWWKDQLTKKKPPQSPKHRLHPAAEWDCQGAGLHHNVSGHRYGFLFILACFVPFLFVIGLETGSHVSHVSHAGL